MGKELQRESADNSHLQPDVKLQNPEGRTMPGTPHEEKLSFEYHVDNEFPTGSSVLQLHSTDVQHHAMVDEGVHEGHSHALPSSHMNHMDPALMAFFTIKDLKMGKTMEIYFPNNDPSSSAHFLTREEADSLPFSLKELPYLLQLFSFSEGSPQAKAMEKALRQCDMKPIKGETKLCATSLESMLDFTQSIFGSETKIEVHSTNHFTRPFTPLQNYSILEVQELPAPKMVACHILPYPYAVLYCHSLEGENKVLKVSLEGEKEARVEAVAVCHMDTSQWSPKHPAFHKLGIEPGRSDLCHFFPADNFVWVPSSPPT
ncbi:BURP domain [Dillenia turbinata]|uniref:BURP domain n=1 Tax=Dillenia turbinata TaxID=194707 RepID=A0AAN8UW43_9MAGN